MEGAIELERSWWCVYNKEIPSPGAQGPRRTKGPQGDQARTLNAQKRQKARRRQAKQETGKQTEDRKRGERGRGRDSMVDIKPTQLKLKRNRI